MMTLRGLEKDEWYPVYDIAEPNRYSDATDVDLDDDFIDRYKHALAEFREVQDGCVRETESCAKSKTILPW